MEIKRSDYPTLRKCGFQTLKLTKTSETSDVVKVFSAAQAAIED